MDFEKLTSKSKELIQDVINLAAKEKHQYISPEHLLKSLLEDRQIIDLILKSGGSLSQIRRETDAELAKIPAVFRSVGAEHDVAGFYPGDDGGRKACRQSQ